MRAWLALIRYLTGSGRFWLSARSFARRADCSESVSKPSSDCTSPCLESASAKSGSAAVAAWEAGEERNLYLANHIVIGTDFSGDLLVYDTRSRREDGEMTLVYWDISYGAQDPKFASFHDFLDWAAFEAGFRLDQLIKTLKGETGGKQKKAGQRQKSESKSKRSSRK